MGPDIEGVLAAHAFVPSYRGSESGRCAACHPPELRDMMAAAVHRAHVAAVLREQIVAWQAEAWDEGVRRACGTTRDALVAMCLRNPYRAAQLAPARVPSEEG